VSASEVGYVRAPQPVYPAISRRLGEQGETLLRVLIDTDGRPAQVVVAQSSGVDRLDEAAVTAARRALFHPYRPQGQAQTVWVLIPIAFTLER